MDFLANQDLELSAFNIFAHHTYNNKKKELTERFQNLKVLLQCKEKHTYGPR